MQAEEQIKGVVNWARAREAEFVKTNPDYYEALAHLQNTRARQLIIMGMAPEAAAAQVKAEENDLLVRATQTRADPVKMAYEMAQAVGYVKGARLAPPQPQPQPQPRFDVIEAGQRQSGTLSQLGGGGSSPDMTLEELARMPEGRFGDWIDKHPAQFRRLKGASH